MRAPLHPLFVIAMGVLFAPLARGQGASAPPPTSPVAPAPTSAAGAEAAPVPTAAMPDVPSEAPPPAPTAPADEGAGQPPAGVPPAPPIPPQQSQPIPPPAPGPPPVGMLGTQVATPGEAQTNAPYGAPQPTPGFGLGIELGVGMAAGGRFPASEVASQRSVEEAVDATFGLAFWLGSRRMVYGLAVERTGLGKDHFATSSTGETLQASYGADSLSLLGRWYFADVRPAFYLGAAVGPAFGTVRATGTHAPEGGFVEPGQPYECSRIGTVGATASLSAGVEFEIVKGLSLVTDARATGFFLSNSANTFDGCAPGTGPALVGLLRLGASYRFDL